MLSKELRNEFKPTDSFFTEKSTSPATVMTCDVSVIDNNPRLVLELPAKADVRLLDMGLLRESQFCELIM